MLDPLSHRQIVGSFALVRTTLTANMKAWGIAVLSLLLTSAATAKESVLVAGKDELIWSINEKAEALDTSTEKKAAPEKAIEALSLQAAEVLTEVIKEFGKISGRANIIFVLHRNALFK